MKITNLDTDKLTDKCPYHVFEMPEVFIAGGVYCEKMKNKRICAFHDKYIKNFIPE